MGGFPVEPPGLFGYIPTVFIQSLTFVERESPDTLSLLSEARAGDAESFGELCGVYQTPLLRQAMRLCGNAALAEDLAQDTLVEGWRCLRRYHGRCQFFTWLCAILLNRDPKYPAGQAADAAFRVRHTRTGRISRATRKSAGPRCAPDESVQLREQAAALRACIQSLPVKQQQVIYLRFYVDDSLEGIAAALGCPLGTVKSRLFNALDRLREINPLAVERNGLRKEA